MERDDLVHRINDLNKRYDEYVITMNGEREQIRPYQYLKPTIEFHIKQDRNLYYYARWVVTIFATDIMNVEEIQ